LKQRILNDNYAPIKTLNSKASTDLVDLANRMLSKQPSLRPSTQDIFNMPFVRRYAKDLGFVVPTETNSPV